ncbi:MAG: porin [Pseudomonadota bacterium]
MSPPKRSLLALAVLAVLSGAALAADGPTVTTSGFGTAALTMTDTDDAEFVRPNQAAGVKKSPRPGVDSNFGFQVTAKFNDWLSATGQGLVRKNATDNYGAELAWAFVKMKASDDFSFRVGRMGTPIYMISDFRNVGYANTMIRPPAEVYRQVNGGAFDGADVLFQHSYGDTTVTAQFGFGRALTRSVGSNVEFKPITALHLVVENGPVTLRFGRADAKFSVKDSASLSALPVTVRSVGFGAVADQLSITDVKGSFTSVGTIVDWNNFLVQAEYAVRKTDTRLVMDTTSWYAMFGYRIAKFTPYYYHGDITQQSIRSFSTMPTTGPLAALTAGVNGAIKAALQSTNALGVRWDFSSSAAFKFQVDRISPKEGAGAFINVKPGFKGPVNVYAAGIDFVF